MTPIGPYDRTSPIFRNQLDDIFGVQLPRMVTEANDLQTDVTNKQGVATSAASTATAQALTATSAAGTATAQALLATTAAGTAVNAPGTMGTSTTSATIGKGSKTLTTQASKAFPIGGWISVSDSANPVTNRMDSITTGYNSTTGQLDFICVNAVGSGTIASWNISVGAQPGIKDFDQNPTTTTGLTFGYYGGNFRLDNVLTAVAAGTIALTASATNYLEVSGSGLTKNTTGFNSGRSPLYTIVTGASSITSVTDSRGQFVGITNSPSLTRVPRTSNTQIVAGDAGKFFDITSGTFTQTFDTPANLGVTWYAWVANNGTGDITIPASDGVTNWVMYPGAVRLFQCDGTTLRSIPVKGGKRTWSSSGSHVIPPGIPTIFRQLVGAGGGGGSGVRQTGGGAGGSGGGGGQYSEGYTHGIAAGTSVTVTIGAGGSGGAARTTDGGTNGGGNGGNTSFGSYASALGGTGGGFSATPGTGLNLGTTPSGALWLPGDGAAPSSTAVGSTYAGGGSPAGAASVGGAGYRSLFGGGGGGVGGGSNDGVSNVNSGGAGGASGKVAGSLTTIQGLGGAGGATGVTGSAGTVPVDSIAGHGGGGGGSIISGTAGSGGAGGVGAGGGGGGYTVTGTSGAGGAGGNGICVVTEII